MSNVWMLLLLVALLLGLTATLAWAYSDYRAWLVLGPGGLPSTLSGWLITTRLRLKMRDPIEVEIYREQLAVPNVPFYLDKLPRRCGPRPQIARWPIPHRQLSQFIGTAMRQRLNMLFDQTVSQYPTKLEYQLSHYEKHNQAITLCQPVCGHAQAKLSCGEIAHIHPGDGSMHMILSARDAKTAIEAGWVERHPMSGVLPELPDTYLYVYPPRDETELSVVGELLRAAIAHMSASR